MTVRLRNVGPTNNDEFGYARTRDFIVLVDGNPIGNVFMRAENRGWWISIAGSTRVRDAQRHWRMPRPEHYRTGRSSAPRRDAVRFLLEAAGYDAEQAYLADAGYDAEQAYSADATRARDGRASPDPEERAFGVEIELTGPEGSVIVQAIQRRDVAITDYSQSYRGTNGTEWELKHDGSVSGRGLELVSPKLRGTEGLAELKKVCEALAEVGATVDQSCGLHVHHDMRGMTGEEIKTQVFAFLDRQPVIRRLVAPSRRSNSYCREWTPDQIEELRGFREQGRPLRDISYYGPRGAINLQAYARHGSVGVRFHGGTASYRKISAWVRFGQALFAAALDEAAVDDAEPRAMLRDLRSYGLTTRQLETLMRFETAAIAAQERAETDDFATDEPDSEPEPDQHRFDPVERNEVCDDPHHATCISCRRTCERCRGAARAREIRRMREQMDPVWTDREGARSR